MIFATLWFLWPIVLLIHPGRSWRRVLVPLAAGYVFYVLWSRVQSRGLSELSVKLGAEPGIDSAFVDLTPHDLAYYAIAYGCGWFDAQKDANTGRQILEAYGFGTFTPSAPNFSDEAIKECGIEINHVTGSVVNTWILGHSKSYNQVMIKKIRQRCPAVVKAAEDEEARWKQSYIDGENVGRTEAEADLRDGRLAIVVDDPERSDDAAFEKWLREKYHVNLKRVNPRADPKTSNNVGGYASGYNRIADAEIERRFGKAADYEIWGEWAKIPQTNPLQQ